MKRNLFLAFWLLILMAGAGQTQIMPRLKTGTVLCGADRIDEYLPLLRDARVGVVANATSQVGGQHLVDRLIRSGIRVVRIFAPEHGFRGEAEAGETIQGHCDSKTGLPVISLYGKHYKPRPADLDSLDYLIFDIQDVGVRFYTYISTLHYVMEACAENDVPLLVLDRPNPNGFYVDGPVLDTACRSFVGMHPVPVVHGMTIGEYAQMINGEGWLTEGIRCGLKVIPCEGWDHQTEYILPVKPSPNLPDQISVYLYPSLCLFEGTIFSVGRGTPFPFQVYGYPGIRGDFEFTPVSLPGVSLHPPLEGQVCSGRDLRKMGVVQIGEQPRLVLDWIRDGYDLYGRKEDFFIPYFTKLAGGSTLQQQIRENSSDQDIRTSWQAGLDAFRKTRRGYLLYPDVNN